MDKISSSKRGLGLKDPALVYYYRLDDESRQCNDLQQQTVLENKIIVKLQNKNQVSIPKLSNDNVHADTMFVLLSYQ